LRSEPLLQLPAFCGAFTPQGEFLKLPELDLERLQTAWQEAVFALYLAEEKIEPEVIENMRTWPHSGFSIDQSVFLPAGDRAGIERLAGYMARCPFSLSRLVKVSQAGQVIYKAEEWDRHPACLSGATGWKPIPQPAGPSGTSGSSTHWISWPSSPSTFRRRART
jgi:hypothetical protein